MRANIGTSLTALVLVTLIAGCDTPVAGPEPVRPVRAIKVGDLKAISSREFPGRAAAKDDVELSFQVVGPLVSLPVDVGTQVKKGDVIASIDLRDFETALASAQGNLARAKSNLLAMERGARPEEIEQLKAALVQAEASNTQAVTEHKRNAELVDSGAVSKSEFDLSLARQQRTAAEVKSATEALNIGMAGARPEDLEAKRSEIQALEAAVAAAKNQLDYATLTAPFDGEVAARYANNFQTVQVNQPIVRLLDVSRIEITVQVPESLIGLVPQVKQVDCRFDAFPGRDFTGKVTRIGREASQTTRTYPVTVEIQQQEEARILPGMAAVLRNHPIEIEGDAAADLIVPPSSVFTTAEGPETFVWVVDTGSKVARRPVKTGDLTPVGLRVVEGLKAGDMVVTAGVNTLREGQEVKLL
jgi:RND family efflux transporter MFP subunit